MFVNFSTSMSLRIDSAAEELLRKQRIVHNHLHRICTITNIKGKHHDYHIGKKLQCSNCLQELVRTRGLDAVQPETIKHKMNIHHHDKRKIETITSNAEIEHLLGKLSASAQIKCPPTITNDNYPQFVEFLHELLTTHSHQQTLEAITELEHIGYTDAEVRTLIHYQPGSVHLRDSNDARHAPKQSWFFADRLWVIYLIILFGTIALTFSTINLSYYIQSELGGTPYNLAQCSAYFYFAQVVGSPILNWLSEHIGRKMVYIIILVVNLATCIALIYANISRFGSAVQTLNFIYSMRIIQGFFGLVQTLSYTIIADLVIPEKRALANSINSSIAIVAAFLVLVIDTFVLPAIPGGFSWSDNYQTHYVSCSIASVSMAIAVVISIFLLKESCPIVVVKNEFKRLNLEFLKPKDTHESSVASAVKVLFLDYNYLLNFFCYITSYCTEFLNTNTQALYLGRFMNLRTGADGLQISVYMQLIAIPLMLGYIFFLYERLNKLVGILPHLAFIILIGCIASGIRCVPPPIPHDIMYFSAILNQLATALADPAYLCFASMAASPRNKGIVMGLFQTGNSAVRGAVMLLSVLIVDWHARNGGFVIMFFAVFSVGCFSFIKPPRLVGK